MYQYILAELYKKNPRVAQVMEEKTTNLDELQAALSFAGEPVIPPDTLEKMPTDSRKEKSPCDIATRLELLYNELEGVETPLLTIAGVTKPMGSKEFKMLKAIILVGVSPNIDIAVQLQPLLKNCMMNVVGELPLLKSVGKSGEYFHDKVLSKARQLLKVDGVLGFSEEELQNIDALAKIGVVS